MRLFVFTALLFSICVMSSSLHAVKPRNETRHVPFVDTFSTKPIIPVLSIEELRERYAITHVEQDSNGILRKIEGSIAMPTGGRRPHIDATIFLNETAKLWGFKNIDSVAWYDAAGSSLRKLEYYQIVDRTLVYEAALTVEHEKGRIIEVTSTFLSGLEGFDTKKRAPDSVLCGTLDKELNGNGVGLGGCNDGFRIMEIDGTPRFVWPVVRIDTTQDLAYRVILNVEDGSVIRRDTLHKYLLSEDKDTVYTICSIQQLKSTYPTDEVRLHDDGSLYTWSGGIYLNTYDSSLVDDARTLLMELQPLIGFNELESDFTIVKAYQSQVNYQQKFRGVTVRNGHLSVRLKLRAYGPPLVPIIEEIRCAFVKIDSFNPVPRVSSDSAEAIVLAELGLERPKKQDLLKDSADAGRDSVPTWASEAFAFPPAGTTEVGTLFIDKNEEFQDSSFHLIWPVTIYDKNVHPWHYNIDAHSGEILRKIDGVQY